MLAFLREELATQYERYYRTRYGKIAAVLIYYLLFATTPKVLTAVLPFLTSFLSPQLAYTVIFVGTITFVTLLFFTGLFFIYTSKVEFFQQYRINRNRPWPWEEDPIKWRGLLSKSIKITLLYILVVTPLLLTISNSIDFYILMDMSQTPSFREVLPQLLIMLFLEDFIFFTTHYALHQPYLYKFHKVHHEYTTTTVTAGLHSHIIEFLLSNSLSGGFYMKIAGLYSPLHVNTVVIWIFLRLWDAYSGHCGYMFSWSPQQLLPFCANDDFHDFHHSHNCGNYASQLRYLDIIFGTNKTFKEYKKALKAKLQ